MSKDTNRNKKTFKNNISIVIVIIIPLLVLTVILWWVFGYRNNIERNKDVAFESTKLASYVERDFNQRILALQRLADRWVANKGTQFEQFQKDSANYIVDMPGLQAVKWIDNTYHVRWIVPLTGNKQTKNLNLPFKECRFITLEKAKLNSSPIMTSVTKLVQGGRGFHIYFPLYINEKFDGFISAIFNIEDWLESVFINNESESETLNYQLKVVFNDHIIYRQELWNKTSEESRKFEQYKRLNLLGKNFNIYVRPTIVFLDETKSILPSFVAAFGALMSLLISYSVILYLRANEESITSNVISENLKKEILERELVEKELHEASSRLEIAANAGSIGVWSWETKSNKLIWDKQMYELYGLHEGIKLDFNVWKNALHPEDSDRVVKLIREAVIGISVFDTEFKIKLSNDRVKYLHAAAKVERDSNGDAINMIGINWDTTTFKENEVTLQNQAEFQELLVKISSMYINIPLEKAKQEIQTALSEIGKYVGAGRAYVFEYNFNSLTASNTYEWCNDGIKSYKEDMQKIPLSDISPLLNAHLKHQVMKIPDVNKVNNNELKQLLISQNIKTLITVPMLQNKELFGFIGFDWIKEKYDYLEHELQLLEIFSQILINIQLRLKSENALLESKERYDLAIQGTNAGVWDWYIQTGKTIFNERWAEIIGYTLKELEPIDINTWINNCHPDDLKISKKILTKHFEKQSKYYSLECRMKHKTGEWVWVHDRGQVVEWDDENKPIRMIGTHIDVTQRKKAEEMIKHFANHDPLTDLPTPRLAKDRGYLAIEMAKRNNDMTAFFFVDLDGFKAVNDNYGHDAGDEVLKQVAERLTRSVRHIDTVSRIGGDEFLIILNKIKDKADIERVAKVIIEEIDKAIIIDDTQVDIGASIGISIYPSNGEDTETLIKKADIAMYKVKKSGKNSYAFAD